MTWLSLLPLLAAEPVVETVDGPVPVSQLGRVLVHEHVLVDFGGAAVASPARYAANEVFAVLRPQVEAARAAGIQTIVECTPRHLGRDPRLLRRLSAATGLRFVTNTGLYQGQYLPAWATTATVEDLAASWIAEAQDGLDGTDCRPGFIKIAVDGPPISALQQRIVRAAAQTALATGLPITMHCPRGASALQALDLLAAEGCPPQRLIVAHADAEPDTRFHDQIAARGAWLSFDGLREANAAQRLPLLLATYRRWPGQLLVSQDAGWYHVGEPMGGTVVPFDWLPRTLLGHLAAAGWGAPAEAQLLITNPARALAKVET